MTLALPHTLGQHFAYALGRLGVLEDQLLKQTDIDRLLGAPSGEEAVKMLRDIEFVTSPEEGNGERGKGKGEFQQTLNATVIKLKDEVEKMTPPEKHFIFDILWISGDRAQLSYNLKKQYNFTSGISSSPEPPATAHLDDVTFEKTFSSPQEIDDAVAHYCDEQALKLAKMSKSYTIYMYVIHTIGVEEARTRLRRSEIGDRRSNDDNISVIEFEKQSVESIRDLLEDMKRMILGPEALFSYAARAMNHVAILKVLLIGKINSLPIQDIKSLLPPLL